LAGIAIPSSIQGISLASALTDEPIELHPAVFGYFTQSQRMVRLPDGWKLIWYPKAHRKQLFDTRNDPEELHDLSTDPSQMERLHQMSTTLYDWLKQQRDPVIESYDALP
jgi:arylsulfatase A-like enzyme